jgi:hypothetical protein
MLFSCTSDDLKNNSTNPVINQLKNDLKLDQFTNKNIAENLVVNWETFSKIEKDGFEILPMNWALLKVVLLEN